MTTNKFRGRKHTIKGCINALSRNPNIVYKNDRIYRLVNSVIGNKTWGRIDFLRKKVLELPVITVKDYRDIP